MPQEERPQDEVGVDLEAGVAFVEIRRPPHNFFDAGLIERLAEVLEGLDAEPRCRAVVLASEGRSFCAGARLARAGQGGGDAGTLYANAARLFATVKPIVAAVQGAAVGGGLGLALAADLRVACPDARFSANFARLGFHHGFGLTVTLPALVGHSTALELLYTGRRVKGAESLTLGLCNRLVPSTELRAEARALASEIALSAPLAVQSIRATMRAGLADRVRGATARELAEQDRLRSTRDFAEGVAAMSERRIPDFRGE